MNNSQTTAGSTSNQYGQTQNPQTPGGQNLSDTAGNLQTVSTPNLFSGTSDVSITQVGDGTFTPYSSENTTATTVSKTPPQPAKHPYPIILAGCVLVVVVLVVSWLMIRKQPAY